MGVFTFLKNYRPIVMLSVFLVLIELSVELFHPYLLARIIDDGILQGDLSVVAMWGAVMIGLTLIAFVAGIINSFCATHAGQSTGYDIRSQLFKRIQYSSFDHLKQFATSSLIMRLTNDITQIQNSIVMTLRYLIRPPLVVAGAIVMSFVINIRLALILLVLIPILVLLIGWIFRKGSIYFKDVQKKLDQVNNVMRENLLGFKLIKAFVRRKTEAERFLAVNSELKKKLVHTLRLMEVSQPVLLFSMNGAIIVILWIGSESIQTGALPVGDLVAIVNYILRITAALTSIPMMIMTFSRAKASSDRLMEVMDKCEGDEKKDTTPSISRLKGQVAFKHVSFSYDTDHESPVLSDVSFFIEPGQRVAVLGATGSGKSTVFQLIPRLYRPYSGEVLLDGKDIKSYPLKSLRSQISYVSQETILFTGTIRENICWGKPHAGEEEMIQAAKDAQIHDVIMKLPNQYESSVSQRGMNLSGGQKQRIAIARALIRQPAVLLLDDSTSALDNKTEARFLSRLNHYQCTTIMITQKITTAIQADQIILFDHGKIVDQGSHEELLTRSKIYQTLIESQGRSDEGLYG
ncbi:ABC transporter ATP-binding protein [Alkalicoccobacillus murimartini]|uniref:ATP-binding cassette subfamily B protein n=1 Tax=Alkalicoccobacillus murimartini TaxID=171685 RepID=A0ABT9YIU9_9BACI|nr:ABC transporter ATP-binding protein [Alkalicoccobacillus murimartini]MDQ0207641.1 ATP-binding cassette subfamily B protein [Alkalicoccobacillus murimartini]